jgi:hypothetical protein
MKRVAMLVSLALLAACDSHSLTAPEPKPSVSQTAVMSLVRLDPTSLRQSTDLYFGSAPIDTAAFGLGQISVDNDRPTVPVLLEGSASASLAILINSARWMLTDGKVKPIFELISDWQAENPKAHPGVVYDGSSDIIFHEGKYPLLPNGQVDGTKRAIETYSTRHRIGQSITVADTLSAEVNTVKYVFPTQRIQIRCAGNDSLVFSSRQGLGDIIHDVYGKSDRLGLSVQRVMVRCTVYSNADRARFVRDSLAKR